MSSSAYVEPFIIRLNLSSIRTRNCSAAFAREKTRTGSSAELPYALFLRNSMSRRSFSFPSTATSNVSIFVLHD